MNKDTQINFRISSDLLKVLKTYCAEKSITISGYFMVLTQDILVNEKFNDRLGKELQMYIIKSKRKELCNRLYIVKNMYRRIMDMAMSYFFTTGSVNMKAINAVIDSFVAEFEHYDSSLKKKIDVDFRITVKRLRNQEFLLGQTKNIKMLNYVSSK